MLLIQQVSSRLCDICYRVTRQSGWFLCTQQTDGITHELLQGRNALMEAAEKGHLAVVQLLLNSDSLSEQQTRQDKQV